MKIPKQKKAAKHPEQRHHIQLRITLPKLVERGLMTLEQFREQLQALMSAS